MLKTVLLKNDSVPYVGAGVSFGSGIYGHFNNVTWSDVGVLVGILVAIGGFLMQWYYRAKEIKIKEEYYKQKLQEENPEEHSDEQN